MEGGDVSDDTSLDPLLSSASDDTLASVAPTYFWPPLLDCLGLIGLGVSVAGTLVLASVGEAILRDGSSPSGGRTNSALSFRPFGTRCIGGSFAAFWELDVFLADACDFGMMVGVVIGGLW